jgi:hypothetical protein
MKKLLVLSTVVFCFISAIKAQSNVKEISYQATQQFYDDFGNLPVLKSERTPYFDEVTFLKDRVAQIAFYDAGSDLVGTMTDKSFEDLPKDAQDYIDRHYGDYTVKAVHYFKDNEANGTNMNLYDQEFENEDSYFVELERDSKTVILHVTLNGSVYFFSELK